MKNKKINSKKGFNKYLALVIVVVGIFVATVLALSAQDIRNFAIGNRGRTCANIRCATSYRCQLTPSGPRCMRMTSPPALFR